MHLDQFGGAAIDDQLRFTTGADLRHKWPERIGVMPGERLTKTMRDIEDGDLDSAHRERYRDLSGNKPTVMSYDRLMEWMQHETDSHGQTQNCAPE